MQILFFGEGKFQIKTKVATINTGEQIKINDFIIPGPGEYEVAGVEVENRDGMTFFRAEDINIIYLDKRKKPFDEKEVESIDDDMDILMIPIGGGEVFDPKEALTAIGEIEPKIVIPMHFTDITEFSKVEGISFEKIDALKINKSSLTEEERKIIILNAQKPKTI